jgi:hypothetical protein
MFDGETGSMQDHAAVARISFALIGVHKIDPARNKGGNIEKALHVLIRQGRKSKEERYV